ncbi:MAG: RNA polymerase sigma factor [Cyclobacteriaceae bacterium]|jgi:RNA polymerase sigma factor (sigma-70 family)
MSLTIYRATDTEWVARCRRHDRQAQRYVYEFFASRMYALCCRYIASRMEAEDVMVTAFTKVFERIDQFKGEGSFEGWIRRIMVNECLTYLRRNKSLYLDVDVEKAEREPDYQALESHLQAEDLMNLIAALPTGYRMVFNLYAIEGYSHQEIAAQLGITENTSKSQLSRARALLQKRLIELDVETKKSEHHGPQHG